MKTNAKGAVRVALVSLLVLLGLGTGACSTSKQDSPEGQGTSTMAPAAQVTLDNLTGKWLMVAVTDHGQVADMPDGDVRMTIASDGNTQFSTGCNNRTATLLIDDENQIQFEEGVQTLVACPEDLEKLETIMGQIIDSANGATLTQSGELTILSPDGTLVFQRQ